MSSIKPASCKSLTPEQQKLLLELATESIRYGVEHRQPMEVDSTGYDAELQVQRATFVTLEKNSELRGCIGSLEAYRPLVEDVMRNAYAAAFSDPRFPGVVAAELPLLTLHISLLSIPEEITADSEEALIQQLEPGVDGLVLTDGIYRSTFLPVVWESLPTEKQFLSHLKQKAGLPANYWSDTIRFKRYYTEVIE